MRIQRLVSVLVVGSVLLSSVMASAQVTRGPYLQQGTDTSAIVVWRTATPTTGRVWYGLTPTELNDSVDAAGVSTQHEVTITGLMSGTRYYYAVGTTAEQLVGGTPQHCIDTSPDLGTVDKVRMWIVGDSGTGGTNQALVRDAMLDFVQLSKPHLFLHMGDMAYGSGKDDEFQFKFFDMYQTILRNTFCWPTMGNHEGYTSDSDSESGPYYDAYALPRQAEAGGLASGTEAYYSFDYSNIHFIILDSYETSRDVGDPMLTWLEEDLAATEQEWLIAYWHHPPYTKGSHDSDTENALIEMRENALPILEAGGVDLVLGGHSHIYERSHLVDGAYDTPTTAAGHIVDAGDGRPLGDGPYTKAMNAGHDGAIYVVAGHGGTGVKQEGEHPLMVMTEKEHGSVILDVHGSTLTGHNIRKNGVVSDSFALIKGDAILLTTPNGREALAPGMDAAIQWVTVGDAPEVTIEFSHDQGDTWTKVVGPITNTGSYSWSVPPMDTIQGLIRVSGGGLSDESDATFTVSASVPTEIIAWNAVWRYHDAADAPPSNWASLDFDDNDWSAGPGQLGYGDNDENTVLLNEDPNIPSCYFRRTVTLENPTLSGVMDVMHDDGVAVWVNGTKVFEDHILNGLGHSAYAGENSSDDEVDTITWKEGEENPFVEGENLIAVMVKQGSGSSSDLSFDLALMLTPYIEFVPPEPDPELGPDSHPELGPESDPELGPEGDATASAEIGPGEDTVAQVDGGSGGTDGSSGTGEPTTGTAGGGSGATTSTAVSGGDDGGCRAGTGRSSEAMWLVLGGLLALAGVRRRAFLLHALSRPLNRTQ